MSLLKESPKIPHLYSFVITQMSFKGLFDCGHRCFIAATVLYMQLPVIYSFQGISWICSSSIISKPTGAPKSTPPPSDDHPEERYREAWKHWTEWQTLWYNWKGNTSHYPAHPDKNTYLILRYFAFQKPQRVTLLGKTAWSSDAAMSSEQ